jgi:mRNA interferase MazF
MRRGEIRWYAFGRPDKKRPVLILTRDSVMEVLGEVTVAPITSTDGVQKECAINLDHIQTVPRGRVGALVTALSNQRMREVRSALLFALGFDR